MSQISHEFQMILLDIPEYILCISYDFLDVQ